ncbi:glutamate--tRNA ligase [Candidatus Gracilibacteria bacterium]|nr:MAG: glutamate--tRNA ligase [Candidatus Gracilibacteria bacterium]PIE85775.1 MAG: glutamate--tRNA ligase [Candidatus Gracilibacteria bacterium]
MNVRTRFAPSPTGYLHIGSLRTVLYNYLYAKKNNGKFLLRIEDTDRTRLVDGSVENMLDVLASVGIIPDEGPNNPGNSGPYFQSERLEIYKKYAKKLIEDNKAYYCFCDKKRLDDLRNEQTELKLPTKYDQKCRFLSEDEIENNLKNNIPYTIRLKVQKNKKIVFFDTVKGKIEVDSKDIDDQVLMKTDGYPTYHLANVVDDYLMNITDVIRGDEWIPSTPKHIIIYEAFGWKVPNFTHLPLLLDKNKKKLSKRTGDVSVESYLEKGYLTEAIINYIALLGWNPKTTEEFFSIEELINRFEIKNVNKSGAVFDIERLGFFSSKYINGIEIDILFGKLKSYLEKYDKPLLEIIEKYDEDYNKKILSEIKSRMEKLSDYKELTTFFYSERKEIDKDLIINPKMKIDSLDMVKNGLILTLDILNNSDIDINNPENIKNIFIERIKLANMKNGQVLWPVRVALSGEQFSPGALELLYILGKEKSIERIEKCLKEL